MAGGKRPEAGRRCGVGDSKPEALVWRKPVLKAEPGEQDSETRPGVTRARCVPAAGYGYYCTARSEESGGRPFLEWALGQRRPAAWPAEAPSPTAPFPFVQIWP